MSRLRANATKPEPRRSKNVDIAKRNLQGELTVTVPISCDWTGNINPGINAGAVNFDIGIGTDVHTRSIVGALTESELFRKLATCFDDFRISDAHLCIDVAKAPIFRLPADGVIAHHHIRYRQTVGIDQTWHDAPALNSPLDFTRMPFFDQNGGTAGDFVEAFRTAYVLYGNQLVGTFTNNQADSVTGLVDVVPMFLVAAASKRTIPTGFFQYDPSIPNGGAYVEPSFDELMSYGSCIYQSKMPGAQVHLSLDVKGSSTSERSITYPTDVITKLNSFSPMQQNGRFCPFVLYGVKTGGLTSSNILSAIGGSSGEDFSYLSGQAGVVADGSFNLPEFNIPVAHTFNNGDYDCIRANYEVQVSRVINYDIAGLNTTNPDAVVLLLFGNFDNRDLDNFVTNYVLNVQGYITCRFKRLKTISSHPVYTFCNIGISFNDSGSGCFFYSEAIDGNNRVICNPANGNYCIGYYATLNDDTPQSCVFLKFVTIGTTLRICWLYYDHFINRTQFAASIALDDNGQAISQRITNAGFAIDNRWYIFRGYTNNANDIVNLTAVGREFGVYLSMDRSCDSDDQVVFTSGNPRFHIPGGQPGEFLCSFDYGFVDLLDRTISIGYKV